MNKRIMMCVKEVRGVGSRTIHVRLSIRVQLEVWSVYMHQEWREQRTIERKILGGITGMHRSV